MGLLEYVEKLRGESEAKRRRIAFWTSLILTLFIALIWLTAWRYVRIPETDVWLRIKTGWQTIIK